MPSADPQSVSPAASVVHRAYVRFARPTPDDPEYSVVSEIAYRAVDGLALYQGDIVLGPIEQVERESQTIRAALSKRSLAETNSVGARELRGLVITSHQRHWPNKQVPYRVSADFLWPGRVTDAVNLLNSKAASLRFIPAAANATDYVEFVKGGSNHTQIGYRGGRHEISILESANFGNVLHEMCHAAGIAHEHCRPDRDTYVEVFHCQIDPRHADNFEKESPSVFTTVGPYDYDSIMHYSETGFCNPAWATYWDFFVPFELNGQPCFVCYSRTTGDVEFDRIEANGTYERLARDQWRKIWTHLMPFDLGTPAQPHLLCYSAVTGEYAFDRIVAPTSTTIGLINVASGTWATGWQSFTPFVLDGQPCFLSYGREGGLFSIDRIETGCALKNLQSGSWGAGWRSIVSFPTDKGPCLLFYGQGGGAFSIDRVNSNGSLTNLQRDTWRDGWTTFTPYVHGGRVILLSYASGGGWYSFDAIDSDGAMTPLQRGEDWGKGWSVFMPYYVSNSSGRHAHLLFYRRSDGFFEFDRFLANGFTYECLLRRGVITLKARNGAAIGQRDHLSAGDIAALNHMYP